MVDVPRGTFFCTLREMQSAWAWGSDKRVRDFLNQAQLERMINVCTDAKKTHVTICNYDKYQAFERNENAIETHDKTNNGRAKEQETKNQLSVAKATDGEAIKSGEINFSKELFERAVSVFGRHGVSERDARCVIGKWRKNNPNEDILNALLACDKVGVVDPIAWVTAYLATKKSGSKDFDFSNLKDKT